jgi:hypothetical protein
MLLALISWTEFFDLAFVATATLAGAFVVSRLRRKDQLRRVEQKERRAEINRSLLRRQKEWDEAQRYFGGTVR